MPRSPASRTDQALLAALADRGLNASPYQLERWRAAGLLPRNRRRGLGRGMGSASDLDETAIERAVWLAGQARQGRALPLGHVIERFAAGQPVDEGRVRAAFGAQLDRVARKLAADTGDGDSGWQARYDAANRTARGATLVDWQDLVDALNEVPERARVPRSQEHAAARTIMRVLADGTETSPEDLLQAFGTYGTEASSGMAQLVQRQHQSELSGIGDWAAVTSALSIDRFREVLASSPIEDLQRAAEAVFLARAFQAVIVLMGSWPAIAARNGPASAVPAGLRRAGPSVISRLTADLMWQQWGRYQGALTPKATLIPLVVTALTVLMAPGMLARVEDYRQRLEALMHEITAAAAGPQPADG